MSEVMEVVEWQRQTACALSFFRADIDEAMAGFSERKKVRMRPVAEMMVLHAFKTWRPKGNSTLKTWVRTSLMRIKRGEVATADDVALCG